MYTRRSGLILGFHGTDEDVVHKVVSNNQNLKASKIKWDWLGHGTYFWEYSLYRAMEFAQSARQNPKSNIRKPAVLGAVLDLGRCLDLLDYRNFECLRDAFSALVTANTELELPTNRNLKNAIQEDFLLRELDCAVLETVHKINYKRNLPPFDSVRGAFWEGSAIYPTAGFKEKNHIQICIRNPNCIKGFFIPRKSTEFKGIID